MLLAQNPNSTIEYVKAIPDFIWGGIFTVIGIFIGALLSWIPVFLRLRHDSKKLQSILRDIYLSAAEKIGQEINYLANFYTVYQEQPQGYSEAITSSI